MQVVVISLLVATGVAVTRDSVMYCKSAVCGSAKGIEKPGQDWNITRGVSGVIAIPPDTCDSGKIKGFKLRVCALTTYPYYHCQNHTSLYIYKQSAPFVMVVTTPYCSGS